VAVYEDVQTLLAYYCAVHLCLVSYASDVYDAGSVQYRLVFWCFLMEIVYYASYRRTNILNFKNVHRQRDIYVSFREEFSHDFLACKCSIACL